MGRIDDFLRHVNRLGVQVGGDSDMCDRTRTMEKFLEQELQDPVIRLAIGGGKDFLGTQDSPIVTRGNLR